MWWITAKHDNHIKVLNLKVSHNHKHITVLRGHKGGTVSLVVQEVLLVVFEDRRL
jgi:hypothetical protein